MCAVDHKDVIKLTETLSPKPSIINLEPVCLNDIYTTLARLGNACQRQTLATQKNTLHATAC